MTTATVHAPPTKRSPRDYLGPLLCVVMTLAAMGVMWINSQRPMVVFSQALGANPSGTWVSYSMPASQDALVATVDLERGWDHTSLAPRTTAGRRVLAQFSYPLDQVNVQTGAWVRAQLERDIDAISAGHPSEYFLGFSSLSENGVFFGVRMALGDTGIHSTASLLAFAFMGFLGIAVVALKPLRQDHGLRMILYVNTLLLVILAAMATGMTHASWLFPAADAHMTPLKSAAVQPD
jgi:hypothetical protein